MSETKAAWTDGPWVVEPLQGAVRVNWDGEYRNDGWVIAVFEGHDADANAALCAAAPAMAEALENILGAFNTPIFRRRVGDDQFALEAIKSASAALALARGEDPK